MEEMRLDAYLTSIVKLLRVSIPHRVLLYGIVALGEVRHVITHYYTVTTPVINCYGWEGGQY